MTDRLAGRIAIEIPIAAARYYAEHLVHEGAAGFTLGEACRRALAEVADVERHQISTTPCVCGHAELIHGSSGLCRNLDVKGGPSCGCPEFRKAG